MTPAHEAAVLLARTYPGGNVYVTNCATAVVELDGVTLCLHRWAEGQWDATAFHGTDQMTGSAPAPDAALVFLRGLLRARRWHRTADLIEPKPAPERT